MPQSLDKPLHEREVAALLAALTEGGTDDRVFALPTLSPRAISRSGGQLRKELHDIGLELVIVDPRSTQPESSSLRGAVRAYAARVDAEHPLDGEALRLLDAFRPSNDDRMSSADSLGRLWTRLTTAIPAALVILDAGEFPASERALIRHFARFVYADPIDILAPEIGSAERARGVMLIVGVCPEPLQQCAATLAAVEQATFARVRDFLVSDEVVRRFAETTTGDFERLGDLVNHLPVNAQMLSLYRLDGLDELEQTLVDVLAVADAALEPAVLHDALALLAASEYFERSLKSLSQQGLVRRRIGRQEIRVVLGDPGLAEGVRARLSSDAKARIHRALADADRAQPEHAHDPAFVARHYLAAGAGDLARDFGVRAVSVLTGKGDHDAARLLLEELIASDPSGAAELVPRLVDVLATLGRFREALEACDSLSRTGGVDIELRRAGMLARVGEYSAAAEAFQTILDAGGAAAGVAREARLGLADTGYALGHHDEAAADLLALETELADGDLEPSVRDRSLMAARNTRGKIDIVRGSFAQAAACFEANRVLAQKWGWDDEIARAEANLGVVALQRDDHEEAMRRLQTALELSGAHGSLPRSYCLVNLAAVHQRRSEFEAALENALEAMRCARKSGDGPAYAISARNLATIYQDMGAYDRATAIVTHLWEEYEGEVETLAGGWNLLVRAGLLLDTERWDEAAAAFGDLRAGALKDVFGPEAGLRVAEVELRQGRLASAKKDLADSRTSLGNRPLYEGLADLLEAEILLADGEAEPAVELATKAREVLTKLGEKNEPVRAAITLASALDELGQPVEARALLERELARVREVARTVPEEFLGRFWAKPFHRRLVEALRAREGAIPADVVEQSSGPAESVPPSETPEFRAWRARYSEIVGDDPRLHHVFRLVDKVAPSDATVLVYGESGTGKELVASALHKRSDRAGKPMVKVNCAAFVENLLLSELFGHEKGAFTGAVEQKTGRFELADGGTIFLDEIGDISPNTQVALLRVLQEGTFERVGGSSTQRVNVRVVCATNKNLEEMVRRGEFRLDLYYRLKGVVVEMPSLRARREDIPRLVQHFAREYSPTAPKTFAPAALQLLARYSWPGNVRELQNFVRSILLFVDGNRVEVDDLDDFRDFFVSGEIREDLPDVALLPEVGYAAPQDEESEESVGFADPAQALVERIVRNGQSLSEVKRQLELECIRRALIETGGNVTQAADMLQMKRPRLSQIINASEELAELKARLAG